MADSTRARTSMIRSLLVWKPRQHVAINPPGTVASADTQVTQESLASDVENHWKLETIIQWLRIVKEGVEISQVPYLKGCVGLVLSIAELVQTTSTNREDCEALTTKLKDLIEILLGPGKRAKLLDTRAQELLDETTKLLECVHLFVTKLATRSWTKRFIHASSDKAKLDNYRKDVDDIIRRFHTQVFVVLLDFVTIQQQTQYEVLTEANVYLSGKRAESFKGWTIYSGHLHHSGGKVSAIVLKQKPEQNTSDSSLTEFCHVIQKLKNNWEPNQLQLLGASRMSYEQRFIVLRGPQGDGRVASYITSLTKRAPLEASKTLVEKLQGLVSGAAFSLNNTKGQWGLTEYDVYIDQEEQLVLYNFGLLLDPDTNGPPLRLKDWRHWDAFIALFTMVLTNNTVQLNHVHGQLDASRLAIMWLVKHLVIFAWDYSNTAGDKIRNASTAAVTMMLEAFRKSLFNIQKTLNDLDVTDPHPLLTAMVKEHGDKLSGIWDFNIPQDVAIGDIGYMTGTLMEPRFERLGNILSEIPDVISQERPYKQIQYRPRKNLWSEEIVDNVIRHRCCIAKAPLDDTLFLIEKGLRSGRLDEVSDGVRMRWDCRRSWQYLISHGPELLRRFQESHGSLEEHELMLIFSHKQSAGHGLIRLMSSFESVEERRSAFQAEGFDGDNVYFFENPSPRMGDLWGYWSREPEPGHPIWPPSRDAAGPAWAWDTRTANFRVEVSRIGPQQHIRYLHLPTPEPSMKRIVS